MNSANCWLGEKLGPVRVLIRAPSIQYADGVTYAAWTCLCDCGKTVTLTNRELRRKERTLARGGTTACSAKCPLHAARRANHHPQFRKTEGDLDVRSSRRSRAS